MAAVRRTNWDETPAHRIGALLITAIVLMLLARVLLHAPVPRTTDVDTTMQVRLIARVQVPVPALVTPAPSDARPEPTSARARRPAATVSTPPQATPPAPSVTPPPREARLAATLYARDGRARLPEGVAIDPLDPGATAPPGQPNERELRRAAQVLDRPNPIDYRPTAFDKSWSTDGTLGDVAMQGIGRGMKNINKAIFGRDVQAARARPPPDVRFNPSLHERASDLGSEATGDAYKAAPIAFEKAPGHDGEASRRIREALAELQRQTASCDAARLLPLVATVRGHLADLEQVERAYAKGADPVMAEQLLPRQADSAYDLARRALWYAREKTDDCRRP
ncbi:MAG TPA: hypothetical protein VGC74_12880 [Stenotrophomonas sp.]